MKWTNKICIGTPQFSGFYGVTNKKKIKNNSKKIKKIFKSLRINNINYLDTALDYEEAEKNLFDSKIDMSKFQIITKIPKPQNEKNYKEKIVNKIIESKKKFKIKKFNSILLHDSRKLTKYQLEQVLEVLLFLKKEKLTRYVGFSIYGKKELNIIIKHFTPDILQVPGNIFDRTFLDKRVLNKIKNKKIKLHVRSIFLQGIILANMNFIKKKFKKWESIFYKWENYCQSKKYSKIQLATNYILNINSIDKIIVGFNNSEQLHEFLAIKKFKVDLPKFTNRNKNFIEKLIKPYNWV